jgi:hypothetical protein
MVRHASHPHQFPFVHGPTLTIFHHCPHPLDAFPSVSVTRVLNKSLRAAQSSVFASTWVGADNVYLSPDGSHAAFAWGAAGKEIAVAATGALVALSKDSPGMWQGYLPL